MSEQLAIETITPAMAKKELEKQEELISKGEYNQRRLNRVTVFKYANDMKRGNWLMNNQGIGFDEKGYLRDGRHRLWAVVEAGVPVKMLVVRGLDSHTNNGGISLMDSIDCGRTRNISHQLQIDGITNANATAAAARAIGLICTRGSNMKKFSIATVREILAIYGDGINKIFHILQCKLARGPMLGVLAMYHDMKPRKALEFATSYASMENLQAGSAVLAVRKYTESERVMMGGGSDRESKNIRIMALAVCHYENDETVTFLRNSEIGIDWLKSKQASNIDHLREVIGFKAG